MGLGLGRTRRVIERAWVRDATDWRLVFQPAAPPVFVFNDTITDEFSYRLRDEAVAAGWDETLPLEATITVTGNLGDNSVFPNSGEGAFIADGSYPANSFLALTISGSIRGQGGNRR